MELRRDMLVSCISALKLHTFVDNYDYERFSADGRDRSKVFNAIDRVYWLDWFFQYYEEIYECMRVLHDEHSQRLYLTLIAYRLAGHHSVRIPVEFSESGPEWEVYRNLELNTPSAIVIDGMFGNLRHYDFSLSGKRYVVDCRGLKYYLHRRQYFYDRDGFCVVPESGDYVIDGGACFGDTAVVFGNAVGKSGKVYAFDPVAVHISILAFNASQNPGLSIVPMPYGLSEFDQEGPLFTSNSYDAGFRTGNSQVPLRSIDSLVLDGLVDKVDYIKLDVEGSELSFLRGALASIESLNQSLRFRFITSRMIFLRFRCLLKATLRTIECNLGIIRSTERRPFFIAKLIRDCPLDRGLRTQVRFLRIPLRG
jgi:FkbM family methyltransferase